MNLVSKVAPIAFFVLTAVYSASAFAAEQSVTVTVTSVDSNARRIQAVTAEPKTGVQKQVQIILKPDTVLENVADLRALEAGDAIQVDGVQRASGEWEASRVELKTDAGNTTGQKASDAFDNVKQKLRGAWYSFKYSVRTDRALYERYADERLARMQDHFNQIKNSRKATGTLETAQDFSKLQSQFEKTQEQVRILKGIQNPDNWKEAKTDFESQAAKTESMIYEKGADVFSSRQVFEWRSETKLAELRYDLDELKTVTANRQGFEEKSHLERAEELYSEANSLYLEMTRKTNAEEWGVIKEQFGDKLYTVRGAYYDALAEIEG